MKRADREQWRAARTIVDLGKLTARWLEGDLASQPGYKPNCGPAEETASLIPTLTRLNRAGWLTDCSQPGERPEIGYDGAIWCQRAAVEGFTSLAMAELVAEVAGDAGLIVLKHWVARLPHRAGVAVTMRDAQPYTTFGHRRTRRSLAFQYQGISGDAFDAVRRAVQLTVIDPEWGRNDLVWPVLDGLTCRHGR